MGPWTLRTRVLVASSAVLVALIAAILLYVGWQANRLVSDRLEADLRRTRNQLATDEAERWRGLRVVAELLASFPRLRALLATDAATVRDFLLDYQQRAGRSELLIALDPAGRAVARTDALAPLVVPDIEERWLRPALERGAATGYLATDTGVYEVAVAPADAAGQVFGFLLVGTRLDDAFARRLRDLGGDEVAVLAADRVLGSTLPTRELPWSSGADWASAGGQGEAPRDVTIGAERYVALGVGNGASPVRVVLLQSRDRALAPYRRLQVGLLVIGLVAAGAGIAASAWLARSLTAPLSLLADGTRRVAAGDYDFSLDVRRGDELGDLARAFDVMTRGLRERAQMQKFVSQSTVRMIAASGGGPGSAGERRRLTILISDLRGFTGLAEQRPPEDVVALLNRCLSAQAEHVHRHGGDVDKFAGDGMVALFSGPDMGFDAVRCAVDIHRVLQATSEETGARLEAGIGIATGEVILGSIGSPDRQDFTAIGSHVNLASRLCAMAASHEVLLDEPTWTLVRDLVAAERLDDMRVRGLQAAVTAYRMYVRPAAAASR